MLLGYEMLEMNPDTKQPALFLTLKTVTFEMGSARYFLGETCTANCFVWPFLPNISATTTRYEKPVISLPNPRKRCELTDLQSLCVLSYLDITLAVIGLPVQ